MEISYLVLSVALVLAAAIVAFALLRRSAPVPAPVVEVPRDPRLDTVIAGQGDIAGRFAQTLEAQAKLQSMLAERIEALDKRLGENLNASATKTAATISSIGERLTVIDEAQKNISALSGQVVSLQQVLSNKQSRGAFGQAQMEEIVRDGLPASLYGFQVRLSNGKQPDCIIKLPGTKACIVIDSKFPLESFELLRNASTDEEKKVALARVRGDVSKHVTDIADKYLIPGEVQTPAIMFVPSESIYADLHDGFADVIQKAHRAQVIVVSPNILMLAINTIQTVMKDARMREQADLIQKEVGALLKDVRLLTDAADKLQKRFNQAEGDLKDLVTRSGRITTRAEKIEKVELSGADHPRLPGV
ncbi:MAG TPA: DNA recombination protein RmuC [Rhizomicrobium sp.]|nr:DNA recombination protein RmuC [Rhizomicrobium sp.]